MLIRICGQLRLHDRLSALVSGPIGLQWHPGRFVEDPQAVQL